MNDVLSLFVYHILEYFIIFSSFCYSCWFFVLIVVQHKTRQTNKL